MISCCAMSDESHNKSEFTSREAADIVGVSVGRIQQLAKANLIDHEYFSGRLKITQLGIEQAKARNTKAGRPPKTAETSRRAA